MNDLTPSPRVCVGPCQRHQLDALREERDFCGRAIAQLQDAAQALVNLSIEMATEISERDIDTPSHDLAQEHISETISRVAILLPDPDRLTSPEAP